MSLTYSPLKRISFAVLILFLYLLFEVIFFGLFDFIDDPILRQAEGGFIAIVALFLLFRKLPTVASHFRVDNPRTALLSTLIIAGPFLVIAMMSNPEFIGVSSNWFIYAGALFFLAATEEILCRGLLMDVFSFRGKWQEGAVFSSLLFALLHIGNSNLSFLGLFNIFLAGIVFGLMRMTTDGLVLPTVVHWFWNFFTGMIFGWSVSGHKLLPTLFRCEDTPHWGSFGPEESYLLIVTLAGSILYLILFMRKQEKHRIFTD